MRRYSRSLSFPPPLTLQLPSDARILLHHGPEEQYNTFQTTCSNKEKENIEKLSKIYFFLPLPFPFFLLAALRSA